MKFFILFIITIFSINAQTLDCNITKPKCSTIKSCKEAYFYLEKCGFKKLDRDKDGIPCESICK